MQALLLIIAIALVAIFCCLVALIAICRRISRNAYDTSVWACHTYTALFEFVRGFSRTCPWEVRPDRKADDSDD